MSRALRDVNAKQPVSSVRVSDALPQVRGPTSDRALGMLKQLHQDAPTTPPILPQQVGNQPTLPRRRSSILNSEDGVEELNRKLEQQRSELDNRTDSVNAIQRNFQRLSEMYSSDRQKLISAEGEVASLKDELQALQAERKLFAALRCEFTSLQDEHEQLVRKRDDERCQSEGKIKKLEEMLRGVERENRSMSASLAKIGRELQSRVQDDERAFCVIQATETQVDSLLLAVMELQKRFGEELCANFKEVSRPTVLKFVGAGIAFVSKNETCFESKNALVPCDSQALRLEVICKAVAECSKDGLEALQQLMELHINTAKQTLTAREEKAAEEIDSHKKTCFALESELRRAALLETELTTQLQRLTSEKSFLGLKIEDLERKLAHSSLNTTQATQALHDAIEQLQGKLTECEATNSQLQAELDNSIGLSKAMTSRVSEEKATHAKVVEELRAKLSGEIQTMADMRDAEIVLRKNAEESCRALRTELSRLEANISSITRKNSENDKSRDAIAAARIETLEKSLDDVTAQLRVVESNRDVVRGQFEKACKELAELKESREEVFGEIAQLRHRYEAAEKKLRDEEVKNTELMAERSQLLMDRHSHDDSLSSITAQLAQRQQDVTKLQNEHALLESDNRRLREELQRACEGTRAMDALRLKNQQLQDEVGDLKSAILNASALSQLHQDKIQQLTKALASAEAKSMEATREVERTHATQLSFDSQRATLEAQRKSAEARSKHLREVQEETLKTVKKLIHVEKACESGYSCQSCLQLLKDPVQCAPCGHTFCRKCFEEDSHNRDRKSQGRYCPECDEQSVSLLVPSRALDLLTGKFQYRCQVLSDLRATLERDVSQPERSLVE